MPGPPTPLALLISLIGLAPGVQAGEHPVDRQGDRLPHARQEPTGSPCVPVEGAGAETCASAFEHGSADAGHSLEPATPAGVGFVYTAPADEKTPADRGGALRHALTALASPDAWAIERSTGPGDATPQWPRPPARDSARVRAPLPSSDRLERTSVERVVSQSDAPIAPPVGRADPATRLVVVRQAPPPAAPDAAALTEPTEADRASTSSSGPVATASPSTDAVPLHDETPSSRVLRQLEAIMFAARDEVGVARLKAPCPDATPRADSPHRGSSDVGDEAAPRPVEDGPARRLRKLAARAALAETTTATAEAARGPCASEPRRDPFGAERRLAVGDDALDRVRGGYAFNGLNISFGVERSTYVNGTLVTTTSLNVPDLGRITAGRGTAALDAGTIGLIQSGAGNVVSPTLVSAGSIGTVVQNTLDGQKIQNITVIHATSNGLGVLRGLNLQSSLRGAVIDSLRR